MYHDLSMDSPAGNLEEFAKRSLDNFNNRCLHHYVYNDELLMEICDHFKCEFIYNETQGLDRWFIMKNKYLPCQKRNPHYVCNLYM